MIADVQNAIVVALSVLAFGLEVYALVDAIRQRGDAFVAAGKWTKQRWLIILSLATAFGFVALPPPIGQGLLGTFGFLSLVAVVAAAVYLTDVRPAVRQIRGGGSGRNSGPYGPW
jgi:hypothetical protein